MTLANNLKGTTVKPKPKRKMARVTARKKTVSAPKGDRIAVRIDRKVKLRFIKILDELGLTESEAVRMFYHQTLLHKGLPFSVKIPNETTLKAMEATRHPEKLDHFDTFEELMEDLGI